MDNVSKLLIGLSIVAIAAENAIHRHPHFPGIDDVFGFYALLSLAAVVTSIIVSKLVRCIQVDEEFYHE